MTPTYQEMTVEYRGMPAAATFAQSIALAQLQILRRLEKVRAAQ